MPLSNADKLLFLLPGPYLYEARCQTYIERGSFFSFREPSEEAYAAAVAEGAGKTVRILHPAAENLSSGRVLSEIRKFSPNAVLLSTTFPSQNKDLAWARAIKGVLPQTKVLAHGGQTAFIDRIGLLRRFPHVDGLFSGELEFALQSHFSSPGNPVSGACDTTGIL